ncbi:hypothetical protein [Pontibacter cellulosilyticus]|uniref:Uncharacterized protein n=1 Tax=Pontibacter cellulosilyticus TaxID=1720253 RepID=A0A923NB65_9BACT|nr:hypothetical protein [Pontibacter cellulosilyticus]MBC5994696.1 hypothetical protein [Pontibacter cellulosilyticus]
MRHRLLPFFLFLSIVVAQAQSKISDKPAEFVADVKAMLVTGKATNAEKLGADLEAVWNGGTLTTKQQKEIIDIAQGLYRKRMRVNPHMENFFTMVTAGVNNQNMRGKQLDDMLNVTAKAVQNEDGKHLETFLHAASLFLKTNRIYQNTYYRLNTSGGSFSFAYEGASKATDEKAEDAWGTSWDDEVNDKGEVIEDDGWGTVTPTPKKEDKKKAEKNRKESLKRQFIPAQPKVSGPVLKLENVNLTFVTPWDSTGIKKTNGELMLASNMFVGEGGTFDWTADGAPASAEIRKYSFNTSFSGFKAPDVTVTYPSVLASPVEGAMEWISGKRKTSEYPYPKFSSFTNDAKLKTLGENIVYTGGFSMQGNLLGSRPLDNSLSEIVVSHAGERKFRSMARNYTINDSLIMANRASVAIYQQKDSLTHPAMQLRFSKPKQTLTLTKDKGPYARTPFYDTYHKLEITAERLHWDLRSQDIDFSIINSKALVPVQIESSHYYSNNRYQQLVGIAPFHPLQVLVGYAAKAKSNTFFVSEVARSTKLSEKAINEAALAMQHAGYINYDPASGYIEIKEKAWHYVRSSRNLNDYDHLVIKSIVPSGRNATLNLADNKLTVRGVEKITFNNDTAAVYIMPRKSEVHILKNRDIEFDGQVFASSLAFKGSKFKFNYDEFSIDLTQLDTVALMSRKRRAQGGEVTDQVLTGKNGSITGKLYINKPNNKSGKDYFADYPKFDAPVGAQVAFARPDVAGGAYDSTVYFDMPPFKLDSLASGKNTIGFDGTFNSGGIFPPIKTKLIMMPDETLGFYYQPGAKGLAAFGGKGMAYDTIMMSSSGIQSKGKLTYLTATLQAPVYTYYKNAVITKAGKSAVIAEETLGGTKFPVAKVSDFQMNWLPQADTMYIKTQKEPMKVYKEEFSFKGVAKLSPGGLYGAGVVDNPVANVTSAELHFKQRNLSGNHATMIAKSDVAGRPAIKAQDMAFEYDLVKGIVDFESEVKGAASIEFPKAQYKTSMSSARWDMNKQRVSLKADESGNKNWFYSQHPQQEGLQFAAASGEYDLKANTILAGGVPYITVGDAWVVPDSGKVAVAADATIKTLRNSRIIADTLQQYHKLYAGNIDVLSRKAFKGTAVHDYFNAASDSFKLTFTNYVYGNPREKKKPIFTFAEAQADEKSQFYIFPRILYRGKIVMHAPKEHFDFDGDLKLNFTGNPADSDWFSYKKDSLNPANVRIPITKPKAADGTPLHTGLHIAVGSSKLYNTFVSKKQAPEDLDLFTVDGLLSYNKEKTEFKMGREGRAYEGSYEGNLLLYNEASNTVRFEGKMNLVKPMKNFNVEASGSGDANVDSSRYKLDAFMAFDLSAHPNILNTMASSLKENVGGAGEALDKSDATMYKLAEFIGDKGARDYGASIEYVPLPKLSKKLIRSLVINKADLRWSNELKAWYSVGKISVASMLKEDINAQLNGYLEVRQDMNGEPAVNLYLQANPYSWYYISFLENSLTIASADEKLNKQVRSKSKGSRGSTSSYGVYEGSDIDKNTFLEHFRKNYLNGEDGFKIATGQPSSEPVNNVNFAEEEDTGKEKKKKRKKGKGDPIEEEGSNNQ